ncbi:MAG: hypothetical protein EP344_10315 [Bacteroidetes bacterium]|nr:MAG: hypothetical protein EP344_10315 [Bacteroidota bacterium]
MRTTLKVILLLFLTSALTSSTDHCRQTTAPSRSSVLPKMPSDIARSAEFRQYWFSGKAELNVFTVEQERYGEIRQAQAVLIFVTEDLSRQSQIKLDHPRQAGTDRLPVMKLNAIRRFHTGIYDYSLMESVFNPLDGSPAVKATTSVQDWCGQVFTQINAREDQYKLQGFSYFESDGDTSMTLPAGVLLEQDFWSRIRLDPANIKPGKYNLLPSVLFSRLRHQPTEPAEAEVRLSQPSDNQETRILQINFTQIPRRLHIEFEQHFPFRIIGWEETFNNELMSRGRLTQSRQEAYWTQHRNADRNLREALDLEF